MTINLQSVRSDESVKKQPLDLAFDELVGLFPDAVILLNASLQIVYLNSAAEELFGYPALQVIDHNLDIFLPDELIGVHHSNMLKFINEEKNSIRMGEGRVVYGKHCDGHLIPLDISIVQRIWHDQLYVICIPRDISRQIAAQQALNASEQRYLGMIDSQNTLIVRVDHAGRFIFANQAYCRMFGKKLDDLVGSSFTPLVHPDDLPATIEAMKGLQYPPYRIFVEQRAMTTTGWRWIAWEDSIIQEAGGNQNEILGVGYEITERKQIEDLTFLERDLAIILAQQIAMEEALPLCLDLVLKVSDMDCGGIYLIDRKHNQDLRLMVHKGLSDKFVTQSSNYEAGSDRYQMVMRGTPIYQPYLVTTLSKNEVDLQEELRSFAVIPLKSKGETIACINVASHTYDAMPEFRRRALENLAIHIGNIISRFHVQEELLESQKELKSMFDSLQDYVFVLDDQGNIIQVNQKVLVSLGYTRDELIGKSVLNVHPVEQRDTAWQIVNDMLAGKLDTCPLTLQQKDGLEVPVETRVARGWWGNREVLIGVSRDISERQKAEDMIREKVNEIEGFFTVSLDLLCITDLEGHFLRVNKAWEITLGYSVEELLMGNFLDYVHPYDLPATLAEMRNLGQGGRTLNFINRYRCKDGRWRYIEWRSQVEGTRIYAAARDITERKAAEDVRYQQTKQLEYRQVYEEMLTSISTHFISLPSEKIVQELTQVLREIGEFEKIDRNYVFLIDQNNGKINNTNEWCAPGVDSLMDQLQEMTVDHFPWLMEKLERLEEVYIPYVSDLPAEAWIERERLIAQSVQSVLVVPLITHGSLVGFLGFDSISRQREWPQESILLVKMVGDILSNALTRKQMETDLLQSEFRNRALLSAVPDLIFRISRDGVFLDFKAANTDLLLLPQDQIIGSSIREIMDAEITAKTLLCIEMALLNHEIQTLEFSLKIGNSSRVFEARFKDSGINEVTAIIRDISTKARLEQMKSDFINRASHELRTPIATMLLMANLIDGGGTNEEQQEFWNILKSELNRERILVEDLLSVGRMESGQVDLHYNRFDLAGVIDQVVHQMEPPAGKKKITIVQQKICHPEASSFLINADEKALTQVFMNLLGNAIKFTPANGNINVILKRKKSGFSISVVDTGIGIPSDDIHLLFTRFFRAKNAIEDEIPGTGIGLFLVRSILEKHDGQIKVYSELGKGSQFKVWLPEDKKAAFHN
jgi:PAS domain S-box-containing protein